MITIDVASADTIFPGNDYPPSPVAHFVLIALPVAQVTPKNPKVSCMTGISHFCDYHLLVIHFDQARSIGFCCGLDKRRT